MIFKFGKTNITKAHLYQSDEEPYDQRDENYVSSEDDQSYYCEVCDRDFPSEDSLIGHKKEHKLCGIDGCTFSAHPLLVERHISMQHSTGLYHRMKNLSTPEDIEKWLLERKKRYPTKANIELRKAEELEKVERGEIIKQKEDSVKRRKKKTSNVRNRKRAAHRYSNQEFNKVSEEIKEMYRGLQSFPGILNLPKRELENEHSDAEAIEEVPEGVVNHISDEEDIVCTPSKSVVANPRVPSLVADYGSDSDEDKPEEIPIKKLKVCDDKNSNIDNVKSVENNNMSVTCKNSHKNSDRQSSRKVNSVDSKYQKVQGRELNRHSKSKGSQITPNKRQNNRLQLLQRLLARSIQHERNLICQCVKYIVDNQFFD